MCVICPLFTYQKNYLQKLTVFRLAAARPKEEEGEEEEEEEEFFNHYKNDLERHAHGAFEDDDDVALDLLKRHSGIVWGPGRFAGLLRGGDVRRLGILGGALFY